MIGYCPDCREPHSSPDIESLQKHKGNHQIYNKADVFKFVSAYLDQTSSKACHQKKKIVKDFFQTFQSKMAQTNNKFLNSIEDIELQIGFLNNQGNVNSTNTKRAENVGALAFELLESKKGLTCGNVSEVIDEIHKMKRIIQNGGKLRYELLTNLFQIIVQEVKSALASLSQKYLKELDEVDANLWKENKKLSNIKLVGVGQISKVKIEKIKKEEKVEKVEKVEKTERGFNKKIVEIQNALNCFQEKQQFSIKVRIEKLINQFESKGRTKVLFLGRDRSGLFKLAFRPHQYLVEGNQIIIESSKVTPIKGELCVASIYNSKIHLVSKQIKKTHPRKQSDAYSYSNLDLNQSRNQIIKGKQVQNKISSQLQTKLATKDERLIKDEKAAQDRKSKPTPHSDKDPLFIKIIDIEPGSENLNLIAKVCQVKGQTNERLRCLLGDETGTVEAQISVDCSIVMEGSTILVYNMDAQVVKQHILLTSHSRTKILKSNKSFALIAMQNNISEVEWEEED